MSETLEPALTSAEWAYSFGPHSHLATQGERDVWLACEEGGQERHGLAALCLYNQSFGFRRIHADAIRSLIDAEVERGLDIETKGTCRMASEALSRILALLPPE